MCIRDSPGSGGFADPAGGVGGKEAGILHAVVLCVADGVLHGVAVQLLSLIHISVEHVHAVKIKIHNLNLRVVLPQIVPKLIRCV